MSTEYRQGEPSTGFTCAQCKCWVPDDYCLRTEGYCFLCDPNITLDELLSDEPIGKTPKPKKEPDLF